MTASDPGWLHGGWRTQHQDGCRVGRPEGLDLVLLGDSLIQGWGGAGRNVDAPGAEHASLAFGARRTGNLGIAGDRVRHVAWRIEHGALDGLAPRELVLLVGTNDLTDGAAPADTADAILVLGREILERLPRTRLLLHALVPRGAAPDDPLRLAVAATNAALAARCSELGSRACSVDLGATFVDPNGTLRAELYAEDALHLAPAGYRAWGAALAARLADPPPSFADGTPHAPELGWIAAERTAGLITVGSIAAAAAIALGVGSALGVVESPLRGILALAWLVLVPVLLWLAARWPHWEHPRTGYRVLPDRIEAWRGLLWRRAWSVPCARVQFTDVSQGPLQRKHGIATLQIHTAGVASSEIAVPGLPHARALEIRDWLVSRTADDAV